MKVEVEIPESGICNCLSDNCIFFEDGSTDDGKPYCNLVKQYLKYQKIHSDVSIDFVESSDKCPGKK